MISKRFFLIAGGTVTGLGAVLSITPPQFGSTTGIGLGTGSTSLSGGSTSLGGATATPAATTAATPTPTKTKKPAKGVKTTPKATPATTPKATPAPVTTPKATSAPVTTPKAAGVSGTFTGATANTIYGPVQVQITLVNGKITSASAPIYPTNSFRDQQINSQAIPLLVQETLVAQSANIQGVGGASYTSQGWYTSLVSALAKAGL
jgi:uncharacterized protein with FMN-binding domain